jgi:HemY protein
MLRLVLFLLGVLALAAGLAWLADRPGTLLVTWQDYVVETSVFRAVVIFTAFLALAILAWSLMRQIWSGPAAFSHYLTRRRQRRGLDALSAGMIAIGAGDRGMATRYALQARKSLPNEPLTHLLRAQAAQLSGDKATARRIFEAMLATPDTEQLGLRGLFLEAGREGEDEAQRQFAERALRLNPKLSWPSEALFGLQCKAGDWPGALQTLASARRHGHIDRPTTDRRRAVLLTAEAQSLEDSDPEKALSLSLEAHGLAPALIPAAAIAGRLLASRGNTPRAAKIIQRTWSKASHPELATAYAYARIGDSPRDRLDRIRQLAALNPYSIESPIAVAVPGPRTASSLSAGYPFRL